MACIVTVLYIIKQHVTKHVNPGVFLRTKSQETATAFIFAFLFFTGLLVYSRYLAILRWSEQTYSH